MNRKINILGCLILLTMSLSCGVTKYKPIKVYLSFPYEVNQIIEEYIEWKKGKDILLELDSHIDTNCLMQYKITIYERHPQPEERFFYDRFVSTNTFFHSKNNEDIPIVRGIDRNFQHYLEYPVSDIGITERFVYVIYFTEFKLSSEGWK